MPFWIICLEFLMILNKINGLTFLDLHAIYIYVSFFRIFGDLDQNSLDLAKQILLDLDINKDGVINPVEFDKEDTIFNLQFYSQFYS